MTNTYFHLLSNSIAKLHSICDETLRGAAITGLTATIDAAADDGRLSETEWRMLQKAIEKAALGQ